MVPSTQPMSAKRGSVRASSMTKTSAVPMVCWQKVSVAGETNGSIP